AVAAWFLAPRCASADTFSLERKRDSNDTARIHLDRWRHAEYWRRRKHGFRLIRAAEIAAEALRGHRYISPVIGTTTTATVNPSSTVQDGRSGVDPLPISHAGQAIGI